MKRSPLTKGAVVLALVLAGALFFWQERSGPVESPVVLIMTGLEVPAEGRLLRFESVRAVQAVIRNDEGEVVATVKARGGAAVVPGAPLTLPRGRYSAELTAALVAPSGAVITVPANRQFELTGSTLELRF